jgi:hypothetical protein
LSIEALRKAAGKASEAAADVTKVADELALREEGMSEELARKEAGLAALSAAYDAIDGIPEEEEAFFRRCAREGRLEDLVRANIIDDDDAIDLYNDQPERFDDLEDWQQWILVRWIERTYEPSKSTYRATSYGMKHSFDDEWCGFYVTSGEFKGAMLWVGHEPTKVWPGDTYDWSFNVRRPDEQPRIDAGCWWLLAELYEGRGTPVPTPYWRNAVRYYYDLEEAEFFLMAMRLWEDDHAVEVIDGWIPLYDG